ncbi:hypothetical protein KY331_01180 [Candidatus Woesearchaeota archaeon]|nr:hypothetical protein [Candidatus Woesearchaeota archaeon]
MDQNTNTLCERLQTDGGCDRETIQPTNCPHQVKGEYIERSFTKEVTSVGWANTGTRKEKRTERYYKCLRPKTAETPETT